MTHFHLFRNVAAAAVAVLLALPVSQVLGQKIFALSGGNLVSFDAASPGATSMVGSVSGIAAGQMLAGIDFRPQTGELYGLGYNPSTGEARLYTISATTAAATAIGAAPISLAANLGEVTMDFNPTVDRIRVMGSNNQNYRLHPVTGAIAATDGNLAFAATDMNAAADPEIGTGAYMNSYIASTATTLFNYDSKLNVLTTQNPPNNGTQNTVGSTGLAVDAAAGSASLDVFFNPSLLVNQFFLAANPKGSANDNLYSIDPATGAATLVGSIGMPVSDIAAQISRTVPALTGDLAYALTSNNWLVSFDAASPAIIRTSVAVTGVATGQVLVGLDFRPATGELFALGYNATNGESRLYTIKTTTAVATPVGSAAFSLATNMGKIGMDFNPTVDRIRVTSSANFNYRLNPITGGIAATDSPLNFAAGDANTGKNPSVGASAYTNSFAGTATTTLFNYDDSLNVLVSQTPPNNGTLNTIGSSGITVNLADPSSDLDIFYDKATAANRAFLMANTGASAFDNLYSLNVATGAATAIGRIGYGAALVDLAMFNAPRVALFCPADVTVNAPAGSGGATATYVNATAASGCSDGINAPTKSSGLASGSFFPGGPNPVCFTATDNCGNSNSCCFNVTVNETACDVKTSGCVKFELLSMLPDAKGNLQMRVRITNNCTSALSYAAFAVQNGTSCVAPADASTYTAPGGTTYKVKNPNFSPIIGVKFTPTGAGISGGKSDIFQYTLPKLTSLNYFKALVKTADGVFNEVYLSRTACAKLTGGGSADALLGQPTGDDFNKIRGENGSWGAYPNPSTGELMVDLSSFEGSGGAELAVFGLSGKLLASRSFTEIPGSPIDLSELTEGWANGLYFIEVRTSDGRRLTEKWALQR